MNKQLIISIAMIIILSIIPIWAQDVESQPAEPVEDEATSTAEFDQEREAELLDRLEELEKRLAGLEEDVDEVQERPHIQEPVITGESRLSWEYGIEAGGTGFLNENDITIEIPLVRGTESNRYNGKGLRTQVSIYKFNISAGVDPQSSGMNFNEGKLEAKIMWDDYYIITSTNPDYLLDFAVPVGDPNQNVRTNNVYSTGGLLFGMEGRGSQYEFKIGSVEYGQENPYNKYSYGVDFAQRIIPNRLNLKGGASFATTMGDIRDQGVDFAAKDFGVSLQPELLVGEVLHGWKLTGATDLLLPYNGVDYDSTRYDFMLKSELKISAMGTDSEGQDDWSMVNATVYGLPADKVLDFDLQLTEVVGDYGLIPTLGYDLHFTLVNLLAGELAYKSNGVMTLTLGQTEPFIDYAYGSEQSDLAGKLALGVGSKFVFVEDEKGDDKWFLRAEYRSTDVNHVPTATEGDMGTFKIVSTLRF